MSSEAPHRSFRAERSGVAESTCTQRCQPSPAVIPRGVKRSRGIYVHAATPAIPSGHSARSEAESRNPHARSDASHPHRSFRAERSGVAESTCTQRRLPSPAVIPRVAKRSRGIHMHAATPAIPTGHSAPSEAESRNPRARSRCTFSKPSFDSAPARFFSYRTVVPGAALRMTSWFMTYLTQHDDI
jgi:hypothetical protein